MRLLLSLACLVVGLGACAVINGLSGNAGLVCDEASCQCPVPDETEEGAVCIGDGCECVDGFLGCGEGGCQITYADGGCAVLGCSCNPDTPGDCVCDDGLCSGFDNAVVRTDDGAGCIGQCECEDLCECTGPSCVMETDDLVCANDSVCQAAAAAGASGCIDSPDCGGGEVCVFFERDGVGTVGHCFEVTNPGDGCDNGGTPVEGAFVGNTSEEATICPRPVGVATLCIDGRCVGG